MFAVFTLKIQLWKKLPFMNTSERRKKLHMHIADMSDKEVDAMLTLLENETVYEANTIYSAQDKAEIRKRDANRVEGKSKTYSLSEAKKLFRTKQKS